MMGKIWVIEGEDDDEKSRLGGSPLRLEVAECYRSIEENLPNVTFGADACAALPAPELGITRDGYNKDRGYERIQDCTTWDPTSM